MPILPAFCDTCGTAFPSGFAFESIAELHLSNARSGPCPSCGGDGHVSDGVFSIVGDTIRLLSGPAHSFEELSRLQEILRTARQSRATPDEVAIQIEREAPSFESLLSLFPSNKSEWYAFLAVLLAVVQVYYAANPPGSSGSQPVSPNQVAERVIAQDHQTRPKASAPSVRPNKKVGRNEKCPCGSGRKYKKCCGAPR